MGGKGEGFIARRRKTGGRDFPPGVSGNPDGAPKVPEDLKQARRLNQTEFERAANTYIYRSKVELLKAAQDPNLPVLDTLVISLLIALINTGDYKRFNFLLERMVGKVKTVVEIKSFNTNVNEEVDKQKIKAVLAEIENEI